MNSKRRWILPLIAAALLVLLIIALKPSPTAVNSAAIQAAEFIESVSEEGRTRLRDTYTVSAPIAGYLQRVQVEPGDEVELGEAIFRMEPLPAPGSDARSLEQARENLAAARARRDSAEANLATARADADLAASEYERYRELHQRGLAPTAEMERARASRDRQQAAAQAAEHAVTVAAYEIESARAVVEIAGGQRSPDEQLELEMRAPVSGVVLTRHRCCEGPIGAGEPVLDVGNLNDLEVQVDLLSMMATRVRPDMPVRLTGWGGDQVLEALVRRVEPAGFTRVSALGVDEQRVPVIIDFAQPEQAWRHLGVGYRVEAEFLLWRGEQVIQAPTSALFRRDGQWQVFVIERNRARLRPVEVGRTSGLMAQILEGLDPGEKVITHPSERLRDGSRVESTGR